MYVCKDIYDNDTQYNKKTITHKKNKVIKSNNILPADP